MFGLEEQALADRLAILTGQPWEVENTGGGCTALMWHLLPKYAHYLMVTDEGAGVPSAADSCCLGEYVGGDDAVNYWYFANRKELVKFLKVWGATREGGSL